MRLSRGTTSSFAISSACWLQTPSASTAHFWSSLCSAPSPTTAGLSPQPLPPRPPQPQQHRPQHPVPLSTNAPPTTSPRVLQPRYTATTPPSPSTSLPLQRPKHATLMSSLQLHQSRLSTSGSSRNTHSRQPAPHTTPSMESQA